MVIKKFLIVLVLLSSAYSLQTSSESGNPFNQFMSPSGGVNMFSGDATFSQPICAGVTLNYSSNVYLNVRARNDIAPTSWCGLGWNLNYGSIICNHKGTKTHADDEFMWISPVGVESKILHVNRMNYSYYEGTWTSLPNFGTLTPLYSGQCDNFDINRRFREDNFAIVFTSNIDINTTGDYTFYTSSDDGSKLYIDGNLVVSNDRVQSNHEESGVITGLTAGKHTIRVEYFQAGGGAALDVYYSGPGIAKTPIPDAVLNIHSPNEYRKEYYIENDPYTKITPVYGNDGIINEWVINTTDGKILRYGSNDQPSDDRRATRKTFCVGNTVGLVSTGTPSLYPYQWDLASVQDLAGNTTKYYYWQKTEGLKIGSWSTGTIQYTKESHIEKIVTPDNAYILFEREKKVDEAYDPYFFPNAEPDFEPDGFIEMYEQYRLKSVKVFKNLSETTPVSIINFGYSTINAEAGQLGNAYRKSLLTSITEIAPVTGDVFQKSIFEYYTDFNNTSADYNYGAIKSIKNFQGGKTEYAYKKQILQNTKTNTFQIVDNHKDLYFGTLKDGNGYCIVQYGDNGDKLDVYNWDGGNWVLKKSELSPRGIGNYGLGVITGTGFFVVKGGQYKDKFWLYEWDGNDWQPCIAAAAPGNYGVNHELNVIASSEHVAIACGTNKDLVCVYTKVGATWKMTLDLRNAPWGYSYPAYLSLGNNFLTVATGSHQDLIYIYNWDGQNWNVSSPTILTPDGYGNYNKGLTVSSGNNSFVVTGGDNHDKVLIYNWNGITWGMVKSFAPDGSDGDEKHIIAAMGDNFIAITGGEQRDKVWRCTFDGSSWSDPEDVSPASTGPQSYEPQIGNNFFTITGAHLNDKVYVYRWNGRSWDATVEHCADNQCFGNLDRNVKVYPGENFFVVEEGVNRDKMVVYTWDGTKWNDKWYDWLDNKVKNVRGGSTQFGVRCSNNGDNLWLFQKFQDNFDTPIFNFVIDKKTTYTGVDGKSIITSYVFDPSNGNYDTRAGTAKYNKVETILPGTGHTTTYFFNGIKEDLTDQDDINPAYKKLDGLVYKTEAYSEPDVNGNFSLVTSSQTEYQYFYKPSWPIMVNQKRSISSLTNTKGSITKSEVLGYNDANGLPYLNRTKNSDDKQLLTRTDFAFENSAYSITMGPDGVNMLEAPCQTLVYEKAPNDNSTVPLPSDIRSAEATTWTKTSGCSAWMPGSTYKWKADITASGTPDKIFANFNHGAGTSNPNWHLTGSIDKYNSTGRAIQASNSLGVSSAVILNNNSTLPIANVSNAKYGEVFFTSFEEETPWTFNNGGSMVYATNLAKTGEKSGKISNTGTTEIYAESPWKTLDAGLSASKKYTFSGWVYTTGPQAEIYFCASVNGASYEINHYTNITTTTSDVNKWVFLEKTFEAPVGAKYFMIRVDNNGKNGSATDVYFDDLKFYPAEAAMITTYYEPKWNKPLLTVDINEVPSNLVEYDQFGRPFKWWKVDNTKDSKSADYKMVELSEKEYHAMGEWYKPDQTKWYRIVPEANDNFCIDIVGPTWSDGTLIHLWHIAVASDLSQQWKFVPTGDGYYNIVSRGGQTFGIDDPFGDITNGTQLKIYPLVGDNQKWKLTDASGGYCRIESKTNSSAYLDLDNGAATDNGKLQIWQNGTNTKWKLVEAQ